MKPLGKHSISNISLTSHKTVSVTFLPLGTQLFFRIKKQQCKQTRTASMKHSNKSPIIGSNSSSECNHTEVRNARKTQKKNPHSRTTQKLFTSRAAMNTPRGNDSEDSKEEKVTKKRCHQSLLKTIRYGILSQENLNLKKCRELETAYHTRRLDKSQPYDSLDRRHRGGNPNEEEN